MTRTQAGLSTSAMIALVLATGLLSGCTMEQILIGQWYTFYTQAVGACPLLEWTITVDPQRSIDGYLARDGHQRIASLSGVLAADDSLQITAKDTAAGRTANITGQFTSQTSTLSIHGDVAGSGCDGQTFSLRLGRYFARQGGGGGGGGSR